MDRADADIGSLAQAAAREGKITQAESNLVANAVRLDDIPVSQVLTPRPVVTAIEADLTVADVLRLYPSVPTAACRSGKIIPTVSSASCVVATS